MTALSFRPGEFYGRSEVRRDEDRFVFASLSATGSEDEVETHTHDTAHFVLVLAGGYVSSAQGAPEAACTPILVFNPAGTEHRDRFTGGVGRFLAITLKTGTAEGSESGLLAGPPIILGDAFAHRTARLVDQALHRPGVSALMLEAAAWQLVAGGGARKPDAGPPGWLATALEMIRESDPATLKVGAVAAFVGVHPVHLARVFRDWLGCTPGEYLRGRRLERAAALLGRTALALADVAADAGFTDQAHLTRACRAALSVTPAAFRRTRDVAALQYRPFPDA